MKRTAAYMRVSSDKQVRDGDSLAAQRHDILAYIKERPDLILAGEYLDDGVSGTKYKERQELQRLMEDVKAGKIDLILMTKFDRFFRSVKDFVLTQEFLQKYGVDWMAINDLDFDTTTPSGKFVLTSMMAVGELEAGLDSQRIRDVQAYKLSQGEVISGSTPPGYSIKDKHLAPNEDAPNVLEAFRIYDRTGSLNGTMRSCAGLHGLPRRHPAFKRMLQNRIYLGEHPRNPHFCEPIIPEDLFDRVQVGLSRNVKVSQKHTYIFSGLIKCGVCGGSFGGNVRRRKRGNGKPEVIVQYRCIRHFNAKPAQCSNTKVINEAVLERYLLENIRQKIRDLIFEYELKAAPAQDRSAQIAELRKKISRLKELYVDDLITIEEYKTDREKYLAQIEELDQEAQAPAEADLPALRELLSSNFEEIYMHMEKPEKRRFWRAILKEIRFGEDRTIDLAF